ncbi:class E sortase [Streptomyces sp. NPDC056061]|uniref:class E sortase n=1 Tax=Streptomyces sp. NPDC056061 TaxID=3345700 RepID=UPI0035E13458
MTGLRPGPDAGGDGPHERNGYGAAGPDEATGAFEAAVDRLADPLNDPLPGRHASPWFRADNLPPDGPGTGHGRGRGQHRAPDSPDGRTREPGPQAPPGAHGRQEAPQEWYDPEGFERDWYGPRSPVPTPDGRPAAPPAPAPVAPVAPENEVAVPGTALPGRPDFPGRPDEDGAPTRLLDPISVSTPAPGPEAVFARHRAAGVDDGPAEPGTAADTHARTGPERPEAEPGPTTGGRAERRRAAKGRGRRRGEPRPGPAHPTSAAPGKPMSRVEARRAARAAKDSPAVVASRVVGELFITLGVLMLLFVTYQLWWTNVRADLYAGKEAHKIQDNWAKGDRNPGTFEAGQGFAIIHIPKLDVVAPIAEGISKEKVLDRGMVGHYSEGTLRTAMPSAAQGNFALAGHRNTHGEPFRYINRLNPGDPIVVETQDAYYTYEMTKILPQTTPSNVSVIGPVPPESGFTEPGRYITLTTCTPEFTSTYRLIVWGKMVDERPRSKGKPDALVG